MHDKEWKILESIISLAFDSSKTLHVEFPRNSHEFSSKERKKNFFHLSLISNIFFNFQAN